MKKLLLLMVALCMALAVPAVAGRGEVLYEHWDNIGGGGVGDLTGNANYPDNPTNSWMLLSGIDGPDGRADSFGARITGYIIPPETANYTFKVCSDDSSELWLSSDMDPANVQLIARTNGWAGHNDFNHTNCLVDVAGIALNSGQKYYFYALMKEGGGGDNFSVGWVSDGTVIGATWDGGNSVVDKQYVWSPDAVAAKAGPGEVWYEWYDGGGTGVADLTGNVNYPDNPNHAFALVDGIDGPVDWKDNYGVRITGYIIPPETANYTFKMISDDYSELWLSPDHEPNDLQRIAGTEGWAGHNDFASGNAKVYVADIPLEKNHRYYLLGLMKEGTGGDDCSIGWISDGTVIGSDYAVVANDYVTTFPYVAGINPEPYNGETAVAQSTDLTLKWGAGILRKPIVQYKVYFGTDPDALPLHTTWSPGDPNIVMAGGSLVQGTQYFWRVDAYANENADITDIADANAMAGELWNFTTIRTFPVITMNPVDASGWRDEEVTFSVAATSGDFDDYGTLHYEWRDENGPIGAADAATITYVVGQNDQNIYCRVTNDDPMPVDTASVLLHVKKWVGWWNFDEGSGNVAMDSSPEYHRVTATPNDATRQGGGTDEVWSSEGKIGGCLALDGDGESFTTGRNASTLGIGGNAPRSFSVWVKTMDWNNGGIYDLGDHSSGHHDWSLRTLGGAGNVDRWRIQYYGGDRDFSTWRDEGNRIPETRGYFFNTHDTWTHFVHTHDGAQTKIYANGTLIVDWTTTVDTPDNHPLEIGVYNHSNEFNGLVDDLRVFNYPLSLEEVVGLYAVGEPDTRLCQGGTNAADLDNDCDVDMDDLAAAASAYLNSGLTN